MPQSQITQLQPRGGYNSANGYIYTFFVVFADGIGGEVGTKSQQPPYNVGDLMEYTVKSVHNGENRLKVIRPGQQQGGGQPAPQPNYVPPANQPQPSPHPQTQNAGNGQQWRPEVSKVGMCLTQACEFNRATGQPFNKALVHQIASDLLRLGRALEAGNLAPMQGQQPPPQPQPAPPPPQPAQRVEQRAGNVAGPGGSAFPQENIDEDVPF